MVDDTEPIKIKLILLGSTSVGKTSLIRRFVDDEFLPTEQSTIGFDFKSYQLDVDGKPVQCNIWDTAGAERYSSHLAPSFYRHVNGALYVYDVTSKDSLLNIDYWVEQTDHFSDSMVLKMLVGNKIDLIDRAVSKQEACNFAKRTRMLYVETSAKTSEDVRNAFVELIRKIIESPDFKINRTTNSVRIESSEPTPTSCSC